jgi:simple sugar transport system ATP-binding protein
MIGAKVAGPNLLVVDGLSKSFPGVKAVDDVSVSVAAGTIHALLGENGAGKSTLVKMVYGVLAPDAGAMTFDGAPYAPTRPADARDRGVGIVFQHFSLFDALTVTENVALGLEGVAADQSLATRIAEVSKTYGIGLDPDRLVGTLSVGERQRIEIVRCLLQNPRLIIMDEPTSVLTPQEVNTLFETLRRLASEGRSILYISHKLEEIRALCSTATVLRGGRLVGSCDPRRETAKSLAEMMIGAELRSPPRAATAAGAVRLAARKLNTSPLSQFGVALRDVEFEVRAGRILGIAGVAGNGQDELMAALIGETPAATADSLRLDEQPIGRLGPMQRRMAGMAFVPEERLGHGAAPALSLSENMLLAETTRGWIDWSTVSERARAVVQRFDVKTAGVDREARSLSGGNLQKFLVGREIATTPAVFVAAQPTWGVDAGAAALIHREIGALAAAGAAVLLISQDLDELFAVAHDIAVIAGGRLSPAEPVESVTVEEIGLLMGGQAPGSGQGSAHA